MNIIFLGSSKFAVPTLSNIASSSHKIICVVTQPDRQAGRQMRLIFTPVKQLSQELGLSLYQTEDINSRESLEFLKSLDPDLFCVVAFGQILSRDILAMPKIFAINLHASLLPLYRGAAPIQRAIINGEVQAGLTVIRIVRDVDAGPIILQRKVDIKDDDHALILEERLARLGGDLICQALDLIHADKYSLVIQDEKKATLARKLKKEDGLINWGESARVIFNLIRGCTGWPGAFTYYRGKILKIYRAQRISGYPQVRISGSPRGEILEVSKRGIVVATGDGNLLIEELQIEGKKRISASAFISGYQISVGEILGEKKHGEKK
ncbi:MAG: methionyl-tRNA formyltransferase [Candidatus Omnitrophica bacterium]|nr:methionyl-tRNA formyltransferase [Candidatus Omnitrophota bacterium]